MVDGGLRDWEALGSRNGRRCTGAIEDDRRVREMRIIVRRSNSYGTERLRARHDMRSSDRRRADRDSVTRRADRRTLRCNYKHEISPAAH